jgi:hypothetical protein
MSVAKIRRELEMKTTFDYRSKSYGRTKRINCNPEKEKRK